MKCRTPADRRGLDRGSERGAILALLLAFWTASAILTFSYQFVSVAPDDISAAKLLTAFVNWLLIPGQLPVILLGCLVCWSLYVAVGRISVLPLRKQLLPAIGLVLVTALGFSLAVSLLLSVLGPEPYPLRAFALRAIRAVAPFALWSGMMMVLLYNRELRERERRLALFQAQAQQAQMQALRYQVNPHLLYNTLNSIAALILEGRNELAEAMVLKLSDFFRASLADDPHADAPLSDEIALQRLYLEIEQMRFPNLSSEFDVPVELGSVPVPRLLLQPLIENVLKHGMHPDRSPTKLSVGALSRAGKLVIEVSDTGPGLSLSSGTGVGLENVRNRLRSRFGTDAGVEIESRPGSGFKVLLTLPLGGTQMTGARDA